MSHSPIYKRELEKVNTYSVWLVNGEYIRKELDENFVGYDEHYHLPFIPKHELWIDESTDPEEHVFFISHLLKEIHEVESGKTYQEAEHRAALFEKKERAKALHIHTKTHKNSPLPEILEKIHDKVLTEYSSELTIWLVHGKAVRDYLFTEYAEGGHDLVYSFVPKHEIWIENTLSEKEIKFIVLHELHERYLMSEGKDYLHAHKGATIIEDRYRDHPEELEVRIQKELANNKGV